jgi:hypothetical protein
MPSGELVGTTLKYTTGREVTDGHISISNTNCKIICEFRSIDEDRAKLLEFCSIERRPSEIKLDRTTTERD